MSRIGILRFPSVDFFHVIVGKLERRQCIVMKAPTKVCRLDGRAAASHLRYYLLHKFHDAPITADYSTNRNLQAWWTWHHHSASPAFSQLLSGAQLLECIAAQPPVRSGPWNTLAFICKEMRMSGIFHFSSLAMMWL